MTQNHSCLFVIRYNRMHNHSKFNNRQAKTKTRIVWKLKLQCVGSAVIS